MALNTSFHYRATLPQMMLLRELFKLLNKLCKPAFTTVIHWSTRTVSTFLMQYSSTPHATTGVSPSSLLLGRNLRTCLELLKPDIGKRVRRRQDLQKARHHQHSRKLELTIGQSAWVKILHGDPGWVTGVVTKVHGPFSYVVKLNNGDEWCWCIDQLRHNDSDTEVFAAPLPDDDFLLPSNAIVPDIAENQPQP